MLDAFAVAEACEHNQWEGRISLGAVADNLVLALRGVQRNGTRPCEVLADDCVMEVDVHEFYTAVAAGADDEVLVELHGEVGAAG